MNNSNIYKVVRGEHKGAIGKILVVGTYTKDCAFLTEDDKKIIIVSEDDIEPI